MQNQRADVEWREGGVPVSTRFDDPYFSLENGVAETDHVFLAGNGLPGRFLPGFQVAELGFGTGLNALAAWQAWADTGIEGPLRFTSFEAFPMTRADLARAYQTFPEFGGKRDMLAAAWDEAGGVFEFEGLQLDVVIGDARDTLPQWDGQADAWFLDGFSPAKNPELWSPELMEDVSRHTGPNGTVASYTAAGFVRRGLEAAGFEIERSAGYGRKRHMTRGRLR